MATKAQLVEKIDGIVDVVAVVLELNPMNTQPTLAMRHAKVEGGERDDANSAVLRVLKKRFTEIAAAACGLSIEDFNAELAARWPVGKTLGEACGLGDAEERITAAQAAISASSKKKKDAETDD